MLARLLKLAGAGATVFERNMHASERPQGGSLDLHAMTGKRAMCVMARQMWMRVIRRRNAASAGAFVRNSTVLKISTAASTNKQARWDAYRKIDGS